jgi:hypothetical protein
MFRWRPAINLTKVKDDLTNIKRGFSFVQHPDYCTKPSVYLIQLHTFRPCVTPFIQNPHTNFVRAYMALVPVGSWILPLRGAYPRVCAHRQSPPLSPILSFAFPLFSRPVSSMLPLRNTEFSVTLSEQHLLLSSSLCLNPV